MTETRNADRRVLADHRLPSFYANADGLITVKCRCGWNGILDDGVSDNDYIRHLYDESIGDYITDDGFNRFWGT